MSEYFSRLKASEPNIRPISPLPEDNKARSEVAKKQLRAYKPAGPNMVSQSVNKTALHPGGVEYVLTRVTRAHGKVQSADMNLGHPVSTLSSKRSCTLQHTSITTA